MRQKRRSVSFWGFIRLRNTFPDTVTTVVDCSSFIDETTGDST